MESNRQKTPQAGPGQAGESRTASTGAVRRNVYGGGTSCLDGRERTKEEEVGRRKESKVKTKKEIERRERDRKEFLGELEEMGFDDDAIQALAIGTDSDSEYSDASLASCVSLASSRSGPRRPAAREEVKEETVEAARAKTPTNDVLAIGLRRCRVELSRLSESELSEASGTATRDGRTKRSGPWKRRASESVVDSDDSVPPLPLTPARSFSSAKRGRGRPPTTGEYVGLAQAKRDYLELCEEEERSQAEQEVEGSVGRVLSARDKFRARLSSGVDVAAMPLEEVDATVAGCLDLVCHVESSSKNLQGRMRNALKVAASTLREAIPVLRTRTVPEEMALLRSQNAALQLRVQALEKEVTSLCQVQPAAVAPPVASELVGEITQQVIRAVGNMVDARLEGITRRLPPEPRLRPPLAADQRRSSTYADVAATPASPASQPAGRSSGAQVVQQRAAAPKAAEGKAKKRKGKSSMAAREAAEARVKPPPPPPPPPLAEGTGKKRKGKQKKKVDSAPQKKVGRKKKRKVRLPPPPKSAALTLTIPSGSEERGTTYADIIRRVRHQIDLSSLGIQAGDMRIRNAGTGARMLELTCADSHAKADALAAQMRTVLDPGEVRIQRPMKRTTLRLVGLDDSVQPAEVVEQIAKVGGCGPDLIATGKIGKGGAILAHVPAAAAIKLAAEGRIVVGWCSVRVVPLAPPILRCFKCMSAGHLAAKCRAERDLSGGCFRCGQAGHKARECTRDPHCVVCAEASRPATHVVGSPGCLDRARMAKRGKGGRPCPPLVSRAGGFSTGEAMDAAATS